MARTTVPLTDAACRNAKPKDKDYSLFDGQGLYLLVKTNGFKSWRMKYIKPNGKQGLTSFGNYPAISLAIARELRAKAIDLLATGTDPVVHKQQTKAASIAVASNTFEAVTREWHDKMRGKWSHDHAGRILKRLEQNLFPAIGKQPIAHLTTLDYLDALRQVEQRGAIDVAARLRQQTKQICRYAVQTGRLAHNPALDLDGALLVRKQEHRPALPLEQIPALLDSIDQYRGRPITVLALKITLLTFLRSSEVRFARWSEINFKTSQWLVPGTRTPIDGIKHAERGMKMKRDHLVQLCPQAMSLIAELHKMTGCFELMFAGDHNPNVPMSENTINSALRKMGYDTKAEVCGHGFRTMACSALIESGLFSRDAVERQMAHMESNKVRAAYTHKAEFLEERRRMLAWWADWLDAIRSGFISPHDYSNSKIIPFKRSA